MVELKSNPSALTLPFAFGFQGLALPATTSSSATRFRAWPPMLVKSPPAKIDTGPSNRARTVVSAEGFQLPTLLLESTCAMLRLGNPLTAENAPPMYQPPEPSEITA